MTIHLHLVALVVCGFLTRGSVLAAPAAVHPALPQLLATTDDPVKVWVFFRDKGPVDHSAAVADVAATYDERAVERRIRRRSRPGLFDHHDLPVFDGYVDGVVASGVELHVESRWLNAISVSMTMAQLETVSRLPFVASLEPVRRGTRGEPAAAPTAVPETGWGFYGATGPQLDQIDLLAFQESGFTGAGVVIGILDTGFERTHEAFNHPDHPLQVIAEHDFIDDDGNTGIDDGDPGNQHAHGTLILGTLGAYAPELVIGAAYDASFILCKTEDTTDEYQGEEDNYVAALEFIEMNGGDIATSSLSYSDWYTSEDYDGATAVTTIAVNIATGNGMFCCTAAGNGGHDADPASAHIGAPADAVEVITCGAVNVEGELAGFSSDGPTADGRVKPEVLAMGVSTVSVSPFDDAELFEASGTSLSTPLVAGAVACLIQARPAWTVSHMRQFLFESSDWYLANGTWDPLYWHGYGLIDVTAAAALDCNGNGIVDADDLAGGGIDENGNGVLDQCDADLNGDLEVSVEDLVLLLLAWGECGDPCPEDVTGDGVVGVADLVFMILIWG